MDKLIIKDNPSIVFDLKDFLFSMSNELEEVRHQPFSYDSFSKLHKKYSTACRTWKSLTRKHELFIPTNLFYMFSVEQRLAYIVNGPVYFFRLYDMSVSFRRQILSALLLKQSYFHRLEYSDIDKFEETYMLTKSETSWLKLQLDTIITQ